MLILPTQHTLAAHRPVRRPASSACALPAGMRREAGVWRRQVGARRRAVARVQEKLGGESACFRCRARAQCAYCAAVAYAAARFVIARRLKQLSITPKITLAAQKEGPGVNAHVGWLMRLCPALPKQ